MLLPKAPFTHSRITRQSVPEQISFTPGKISFIPGGPGTRAENVNKRNVLGVCTRWQYGVNKEQHGPYTDEYGRYTDIYS